MSERQWYMGKEPLQEIRELIREIEPLLISGDYENLRPRLRTSPENVEAIVERYGGTVTPAPQSAYDTLAPIMDMESDTPRWLVEFDLWVDGKQSDLTLPLTIEPDGRGKFRSFCW